MHDTLDIRIPYNKIENSEFIEKCIRDKKKLGAELHFRIVKKSIDARKNTPYFQLRIEISEQPFEEIRREEVIKTIPILSGADPKEVIIIGAGPAGYFAAIECLRLGLKPIVLERGKNVRDRRRDLRSIQQQGQVNPHSNYCFGEGGAGTYSDGKLYTRSYKRGKIEDVLRLLVAHGAKDDILVDAHPHIGSNKLPGIVSNIRNTIEEKGGRVEFDTFVTGINMHKNKIESVVSDDGRIFKAQAFILATGHSARDIYYLLDQNKISLERKPFALGVRVEHPQALIDEIQYNQNPRSQLLPASSYKLVCQLEEQSVFSFCMCPGGLIVPAATSSGELVVNGMSLSKRDSPFANSGIVISISNEDVDKLGYKGVFANLEFQQKVERDIFNAGNGSQAAPAQRLVDFVEGTSSLKLNDSSYIPGLYTADLHKLLPTFVSRNLREGLKVFGQKLNGYYTNEANVVGVESRTSAPIRIPRSPITLMHPQVEKLFPCGEGAGYAGGILSAAMDGQNVARSVANYLQP